MCTKEPLQMACSKSDWPAKRPAKESRKSRERVAKEPLSPQSVKSIRCFMLICALIRAHNMFKHNDASTL